MTLLLVDQNIGRQARILMGAIRAAGWLDLAPMRLVTLSEVGIPRNSSDRDIWQLCQARQMVLLTANRTAHGPDSLGTVLREDTSGQSLPVVTLSDARRMRDPAYLAACVSRLVEIILSLDGYRGTGRIYIP